MTTYSKMLFASMDERQLSWNLTSTSPLWRVTHPVLLKLKNEHDQGQMPEPRFRSHNWNLLFYPDSSQASLKHPLLKAEIAYPWVIGKFLTESRSEALFHFPDFGTVFLTTQNLESNSEADLWQAQLSAFLDYALSSELWGPAGKWTRFHQSLHTLFEKNGLLIGQDFPGYYNLSAEARKLEKHGFNGEQHGDHISWIMPWDFPLSAIRKLEIALTQE